MAHLSGHDWVCQLPWVLLGLHSTLKEDLSASVAKVIYGKPIAVLGDLLLPTEDVLGSPEFLCRIHHDIATIWPALGTHHGVLMPFLPSALCDADFIFVRRDGHMAPLQWPYDGPYHVLKCHSKHLRLDMGICSVNNISIDWLKPCHVDPTNPPLPLKNHSRR